MQGNSTNIKSLEKKSFTKVQNNANKSKKENMNVKEAREYDSNQILIIIQTVICTLIVATMIFLKSTGFEFYEHIKLWYLEKINDSILVDDKSSEMPNDSAMFVNNTTE
ncbi:MAG: hypothetical protein LBH37_01980 [Oscillospiraceae bacterium]|jgi:hypothetical protein|nr:hypothetical protein [Oscillospiraceae bacterium]